MNWHNPNNLECPGKGYRFLLKDEVRIRAAQQFIEAWSTTTSAWLDGSFIGSNIHVTYRVPLHTLFLWDSGPVNAGQTTPKFNPINS